MPRRTPHERESQLDAINRLYLQGWSQRSIAEEMGVSQPAIKADLDEIKRRWRETTTINLDEHKSKELARIDLLEYEYWEQYEESKKDYESITKKAKDANGDKEKRGYEVTTRTETRTGNPTYLQGIERCIKMRMELLGLEAPKNVNANLSGDIKVVIEYGDYNPKTSTPPSSTTDDTQ